LIIIGRLLTLQKTKNFSAHRSLPDLPCLRGAGGEAEQCYGSARNAWPDIEAADPQKLF
jgi:hypothetical protein